MADQKYTPKGITPLPWSVTINGRGEHILHSDIDYSCVAKISSYKREFNEPYLVHAANEYPKVVAELNRALAVIRCPQAFEIEDVCADIQAVLSAAREVEGGK